MPRNKKTHALDDTGTRMHAKSYHGDDRQRGSVWGGHEVANQVRTREVATDQKKSDARRCAPMLAGWVAGSSTYA